MYFSRQLGNGTTFRKSIKYSILYYILTVFPFLDHSAILHITCEPRQQAKILECIAIITLSNVFLWPLDAVALVIAI